MSQMGQMGNTGHYDPADSVLFIERERENNEVSCACQNRYKTETLGWLTTQPQGRLRGHVSAQLVPCTRIVYVTSSQMLEHQDAQPVVYAPALSVLFRCAQSVWSFPLWIENGKVWTPAGDGYLLPRLCVSKLKPDVSPANEGHFRLIVPFDLTGWHGRGDADQDKGHLKSQKSQRVKLNMTRSD